jgi:hypothetical protein
MSSVYSLQSQLARCRKNFRLLPIARTTRTFSNNRPQENKQAKNRVRFIITNVFASFVFKRISLVTVCCSSFQCPITYLCYPILQEAICFPVLILHYLLFFSSMGFLTRNNRRPIGYIAYLHRIITVPNSFPFRR